VGKKEGIKGEERKGWMTQVGEEEKTKRRKGKDG